MKKSIFFLLMLFLTLSANAYDFYADGFYFNITSSVEPYTVAVTYKTSTSSATPEYTGNITLPATIKYNEITYTVTTIGTYAFNNCTALTGIIIPNSINTIETYSFYKCKGLLYLIIPNSVINIGNYAFCECSSLKSLILGNSLSSINYYTFGFCSGLTSVDIPNSATYIYHSAFYGCSNLKTANIGNSVTWIGAGAFSYTSLTSIIIPSSVTSINTYVFTSAGINSITVLKTIPPTVWAATFNGINTSTCLLIVPEGAKPNYSSVLYWKDFINLKELYSVAFNLRGGEGSFDAQSVVEGGKAANTTSIPLKSGLTFGGWYTNTGYESEWNFDNTVTSSITLYAKWLAMINTTVGENGTISPTGNIDVLEDSVSLFIITPDVGYKIKSLTFNGIDLTSQILNNKFFTPAVTQNSTLEVSFESDTPTNNNSNEQNKIKIYSTDKGIVVEGTTKGEIISVYDVHGKEIKNVKSKANKTLVSVLKNALYIVKTMGKTAKVIF